MKISKILPRILIVMLCIGIFSSTFFGATDINGALAISASDTVFEDFEYPSLEGSSVANADKWSVNYELTGGSKSGSEAKIIKNPANVSEYVLDVHNLGGGASENLQAIMNVDLSVQDYTVISSKLMFSQASTVSWGAKDNYIIYIYGDYSKNESPLYSDMALAQIMISPASGITNVTDGMVISSNPVTLEQWQDVKVVIDNKNLTYDFYLDDVKLNSSPVATYGKTRYNGTVISNVKSVRYGIMKEAWRGTHMYVDDVSVTSYGENNEAEDAERISNILNDLDSYILSSQKYIENDFELVIPDLYSDDIVSVTTDDDALTFDNGYIIVNPSDADKVVDVNVEICSALGNKSNKNFEFYVPSASVISMYDGLDYPQYSGKIISSVSGWSVSEPDNSTAKTLILPSKSDSADMIGEIEVMNSANSSRSVIRQANINTYGTTVVQANIMFPDSAANIYILNVNGEYTETKYNTAVSSSLVQLQFVRKDNKIIDGKTGETLYSNPIEENKWFNLKLVINPSDRNYDLYIDNNKCNAAPVSLFRNNSNEKVSLITNIEIGAHKVSWRAGRICFDDLYIRNEKKNVLDDEYRSLILPATALFDINLSNVGVYPGTSIVWKSSDSNVITDTGVVKRSVGFGSKTINLTADICFEGKHSEKIFSVKVPNTPYYTIDNIEFADKEGNTIYMPVAGGKVKKVSVTEYEAVENAVAIVALYDKSDRLVNVSDLIAISSSGSTELDMDIPEVDGVYAVAFVWNKENLSPLAYEYYTANKHDNALTVYTIGDSTMQSYGNLADRQTYGDMTGWGQVLTLGMDSSVVSVENYAKAGKSSKSFYDEGYINNVFDNIKPGDYLIIQFGHNDQKNGEPQNYTTLGEEGTYRMYLNRYVEAARIKGAYPVFATSIYRRNFEADGVTPTDSHKGYPQEMCAFAEKINVPVIDLHTASGKWLGDLGYEDSEKYFFIHQQGPGGNDNTHLLYDGAVQICNLAIEEMKKIGLPVSVYVSNINN